MQNQLTQERVELKTTRDDRDYITALIGRGLAETIKGEYFAKLIADIDTLLSDRAALQQQVAGLQLELHRYGGQIAENGATIYSLQRRCAEMESIVAKAQAYKDACETARKGKPWEEIFTIKDPDEAAAFMTISMEEMRNTESALFASLAPAASSNKCKREMDQLRESETYKKTQQAASHTPPIQPITQNDLSTQVGSGSLPSTEGGGK